MHPDIEIWFKKKEYDINDNIESNLLEKRADPEAKEKFGSFINFW